MVDIEYISYHTSEDIYTSLLVHAHKQKKYKSILHPVVESKMLSPLDLITWTTGYSVNLMWSFFNMVSLWAIVQASLYRFDG